MNRVSDCHNGRCKPGLDQIEEERAYSEFEIDLTDCPLTFLSKFCTHVIYHGNEWCLAKDYPDVMVTGSVRAVFGL